MARNTMKIGDVTFWRVKIKTFARCSECRHPLGPVSIAWTTATPPCPTLCNPCLVKRGARV